MSSAYIETKTPLITDTVLHRILSPTGWIFFSLNGVQSTVLPTLLQVVHPHFTDLTLFQLLGPPISDFRVLTSPFLGLLPILGPRVPAGIFRLARLTLSSLVLRPP
jgi:hypothetical protein